MNENSVNAYREEKDNGNISKKQRQVLDWLNKNHYGTAREISQDIPGAWRRCSELLAKGLIKQTKDIVCPITNKQVARFCLPNADDRPVFAPHKQATRKQLLAKITELEMELAYKNSEVAHAYNDGIRVGMNMKPAKVVKRVWFKLW